MSSDGPALIHPTYRYLDRAVRLAGLTLSQWAQLVGAAVGAWLLARVMPFSSTYDLSIAITIAGVPAAASLAAGVDTIHPFAQLRALITWRRCAGVYLPGAGEPRTAGYRLVADVPPVDRAAFTAITSIEQLWD